MSKAKREARLRQALWPQRLPVDASKLNLGNSYSIPPTTYENKEFYCRDCGKLEIWTARQQKWWYEEAGGYFFSTAIRCRPCRLQERRRQEQARAIHLAGIRQKSSPKEYE
ncbi:zinc-ribbon domain containing protein [Synechocystis sp. LKSZ1]|uniref:zinc-ribbon domain containing protein n=1 Tax=Synechocystis sp. LKSZ1 TaxID=3144951 RepID=UPI00336C1437